jgi:hypothetical protein
MTAQTILPANSAASGGFDVANSVRMNRGSTDHLRRTNNTGETSNKIGTYSGWLKRSTIALDGMMFEGKDLDANNYTQIYFQATGKLTVYGSGTMDIVSTALFRDPTAWYHVCVAIDTTQGTAANRVKIYVNGVQVTSLTNGNGDAVEYPDQNDVIYFAVNGDQQAIGIREDGALLWNGYFAEVVYIDGTQLTPTSFGEFDEDSGIWKPIKVSGLTFGNNGCYLDFEDSSALGNVVAGRTAVDFTVTNLTAVDQTTDTCTNNFATLNPLFPEANVAYTFGNTVATADGSTNWSSTISTVGLVSGKWYWEWTATSTNNVFVGIASEVLVNSTLISDDTPYDQNGLILYFAGRRKTVDGTDTETHFTAFGSGTMSAALDFDSGTRTITMYHNGSQTGDTINLTANFAAGEPVFPVFMVNAGSNPSIINVNFGNPSYANSSSAADGDGFGNFEFAPPSGYFAICTKNLAEYG